MGRKGMKGFLKGVHKQQASDDEAADSATGGPQASTSQAPAAAPKAEQPAQPAPPKPDHGDVSGSEDSDSEEGGAKGPETRGQVLQRHKREMVAHKKVVQKLGNKKKDEAAKLTAEIEARHAKELAELDEREKQHHQQQQQQQQPAPGPGTAAGVADAAAEQLAGLEVGADHKKPTKAQKRREKLVQQEAEREQRIAAEQAAMGPSDKAVEEEQLQALLLPMKLGIREIRADGHCLYRAVEDQLSQASPAATPAHDYLALRRLTAAHIRSHSDDFLPFIFDEDAPGSPQEQLEGYCQELEGTAVWGGQLELGALAQVLKKQIKIYATGMPPVTLGDEHAAAGVLQLCYLRHAFGLGEHYNSVNSLGGGAPGADAEPAAES